MKLKYNRKIGLLVLVLAVVLGSFIGISRHHMSNSADNNPGGAVLSNYVDDRAGVLNSSAVDAVSDLNQRINGTLLVLTVDSTGGQGAYDYTLDTAESLASQGRLSGSTGMLLVLAIDDQDYAFVYGSQLWELDSSYSYLMNHYLEPEFAKGDYSAAVEDFCDGLEDYLPGASSAGGFSMTRAVLVLVLILVIISLVGRRRGGGCFPIFIGRPRYPRPPRPPRPPRSFGGGGFSGGSRGGFSGGGRGGFSGGGRGR